MTTWPADSISSGFVYVTDAAPDNPEEGETWYDLGTNEAKVYDGVNWHLLTVTDHSEVGGVQAGQHRSDANIQSVVDGQVDADTVDGKHASEIGAPNSTGQNNYASSWEGKSFGQGHICDAVKWEARSGTAGSGNTTITAKVHTIEGTKTFSVTPPSDGVTRQHTSYFDAALVTGVGISTPYPTTGSILDLRVTQGVPHDHNI